MLNIPLTANAMEFIAQLDGVANEVEPNHDSVSGRDICFYSSSELLCCTLKRLSMPWPRDHTPNMQAYPDADRTKNNHLNRSGEFVDLEKLQLPMHPNLLSDQNAERRKNKFRKLSPKRRSWLRVGAALYGRGRAKGNGVADTRPHSQKLSGVLRSRANLLQRCMPAQQVNYIYPPCNTLNPKP